MNFLFIDRVGLFEHLIIIKNLLPNGSRRSKERRVSSTPIPTAVSPQPQQLQNFPLYNSSFTATAAAATELPSFQQQSHCNSSSSYRITLFPTAVSPQPQQQLQNFPLSNSSFTATAAAATEFSLFPTAASPQLQCSLFPEADVLRHQQQNSFSLANSNVAAEPPHFLSTAPIRSFFYNL
jgi:hypothetical protein